MLPRWGKSLLLVVHLVVVGSWIGATALVLWFLMDGRPASDLAAFRIHDVAIWSSLAVLATSVAFSLFTPWGFFAHRWLTLKWLALAALSLLAIFVRAPALSALAAAAALGADGAEGRAQAQLSSAAELLALVLVVALSVFKPWGKTTLRWAPPRKVLVPGVLVAAAAVAVLSVAQAIVLYRYRATPIPAVPIPQLAGPSTCKGSARLGVDAEATVRVEGGRLSAVEAHARPSSHYGRLAEGVGTSMVREQRVDVDAITGATTTSRVLQLAVADALARCPR